MRSYRVGWFLNPLWLASLWEKKKHRNTQTQNVMWRYTEEWQGRNWSSVVASHRMPRIANNHPKLGEKARPCQHLNFRIPASSMRIHFYCFNPSSWKYFVTAATGNEHTCLSLCLNPPPDAALPSPGDSPIDSNALHPSHLRCFTQVVYVLFPILCLVKILLICQGSVGMSFSLRKIPWSLKIN